MSLSNYCGSHCSNILSILLRYHLFHSFDKSDDNIMVSSFFKLTLYSTLLNNRIIDSLINNRERQIILCMSSTNKRIYDERGSMICNPPIFNQRK